MRTNASLACVMMPFVSVLDTMSRPSGNGISLSTTKIRREYPSK